VVQVGAYTDATTLRDARQKVEKLGLKTYTQVGRHRSRQAHARARRPLCHAPEAEAVASASSRPRACRATC
jgi:DedD protein